MTGIKRRHQAWPPCVIQLALADTCRLDVRASGGWGGRGLRGGEAVRYLIEPSPSAAARPSLTSEQCNKTVINLCRV